MAGKKSSEPAAGITPGAHYQLEVLRPFEFGGVSFGTIARNEVSGEFLKTILASDKAEQVKGYRVSLPALETSEPAPKG